jgi:hypothetical protein
VHTSCKYEFCWNSEQLTDILKCISQMRTI